MQSKFKSSLENFWKVAPSSAPVFVFEGAPQATIEALRADLDVQGELLCELLRTQGSQLRWWALKWNRGAKSPYGQGQHQDADDFVMDVLEKVTRLLRHKPEQFWDADKGASFGTWLFGISFCLFLDRARKLNRQRAHMEALGDARVQEVASHECPTQQVEEVADARAIAPDAFTKDDLNFVLMFGKADLSNEQWEAFRAKELGAESVKSLAARTKIPEKTIYGQASQAKAKLRNAARQINGQANGQSDGQASALA